MAVSSLGKIKANTVEQDEPGRQSSKLKFSNCTSAAQIPEVLPIYLSKPDCRCHHSSLRVRPARSEWPPSGAKGSFHNVCLCPVSKPLTNLWCFSLSLSPNRKECSKGTKRLHFKTYSSNCPLGGLPQKKHPHFSELSSRAATPMH